MELKIKAAYIFGQVAFARGITCRPCLDADLMSMLGELGSNVEMYKAWTNGWTAANLAAPFVFEGE